MLGNSCVTSSNVIKPLCQIFYDKIIWLNSYAHESFLLTICTTFKTNVYPCSLWPILHGWMKNETKNVYAAGTGHNL